MASDSRPGEDDMIARFFRPLAGEGAFNLLDDAATIRPLAGCDLVVTNDALVAGVHFFADDAAADIAWKALAVNLSDLAAKGAHPHGYLLAIALPADWTADWMAEFARGLAEGAQRTGCVLQGGDTVSTPGPLTLSVTAFGTVPQGRSILRTAAREGNVVFVSGTIGDAALGLRLRQGDAGEWGSRLSAPARDALLDRYLRPQPRLGLSDALIKHARASMDISDGLVGDAGKMARASGAGMKIDLDAVPFSPWALEAIALDPSLADLAVTGGDDYEVLCSVAADACADFALSARKAGIAVTRIGTITATSGVEFSRRGQVVRFSKGSFSHF